MMEVFKQFRFEAAHSLPHLPDGHKCKRPHGHSYLVEVRVKMGIRYSDEIELAKRNGFVVDYADISKAWEPLHDQLDHHDINEIIKPYSTCEYLAIWIWKQLKPALTELCEVKVQETPTAGAVYRGEGRFD